MEYPTMHLPAAPKPRNYAKEMRKIFRRQSQWGPRFANLNMQILGQVQPQADALTARSNTAARQAALDDLRAFGGQWREAYLGASPEMRALSERALAAGPTEIEQELTRQALGDLSLGQELSAEEQRAATQAARLGAATRGMGTGTSALAAEVLNRDAAGRNREAQRRGFALNVNQQARAGDAMDRSFLGTVASFMDPGQRLLGIQGTGLSGANFGAGFATQIPQYGSQLFSQNATNAAQNYGTLMSGQNVLNQLAHDQWSTQFNANYSQQVAAANQAAAQQAARQQMWGSVLGGVGNILGGLF